VSRGSSDCTKLPRLYLSWPATVLPDDAIDNESAISRVRESFRGPASEWNPIEQSIRYVFNRCNTKMRYLDENPAPSPGEFASRAASACLRENGVAAADDAFGSIYALDLPAEELAIAATEALGL
jgi:hypothetical protein